MKFNVWIRNKIKNPIVQKEYDTVVLRSKLLMSYYVQSLIASYVECMATNDESGLKKVMGELMDICKDDSALMLDELANNGDPKPEFFQKILEPKTFLGFDLIEVYKEMANVALKGNLEVLADYFRYKSSKHDPRLVDMVCQIENKPDKTLEELEAVAMYHSNDEASVFGKGFEDIHFVLDILAYYAVAKQKLDEYKLGLDFSPNRQEKLEYYTAAVKMLGDALERQPYVKYLRLVQEGYYRRLAAHSNLGIKLKDAATKTHLVGENVCYGDSLCALIIKDINAFCQVNEGYNRILLPEGRLARIDGKTSWDGKKVYDLLDDAQKTLTKTGGLDLCSLFYHSRSASAIAKSQRETKSIIKKINWIVRYAEDNKEKCVENTKE